MSRAAFVRMISADEGCRLLPYEDTRGVLSIGYGRNLRDRGITAEEAAHLRDNDIRNAEHDAEAFPWFKGLSEHRQLVILSMLYQLGLPKFLQFKRMIDAMQRFDYEMAADEMQRSAWATQTPARVQRLTQMMREG